MNKTATKEFAEALVGTLLIAGLVAVYCWVTPDQYSGEADWTAQAEIEVR